MGDFREEKNVIIDRFLGELKETTKQLAGILLAVRSFKETAVKTASVVLSSKNSKYLEAKIEAVMSGYLAKELKFKTDLIKLYKKSNLPVKLLTLPEILEAKENDFKKYIHEARKKADELYLEIQETSIDPLIFIEFFNWSMSLDYNALKKSYTEIAKQDLDEKKIDGQIRKQLLKALSKLTDSWDHERH